MKIDIIQPSGYCFGVMNAINEAIKIKENYPFNNVYVLGELVHNEDVIRFLNNHDIHTLVVNNNEEEVFLFATNEASLCPSKVWYVPS